MNPAIKLVAGLIAAAILVTLAVVAGMLVLGVMPGHPAAVRDTINAAAFVQRGGGHGGGGHK